MKMNMDRKYIIIYILIFAFILRLGLLFYFAGHHAFETWEYEEVAKNLVNGMGFKNEYLGTTYRSCTTPFYPYFCAALYKIFGINHVIVAFAQIVISTLMCLVVFDIARRVCNERVGLFAAALFALHPGLAIYSASKIHPLVFDSLFLSLTLWAFLYLRDNFAAKNSFLAGLIIGLCIFTRSTIIAFLPIAFIWLIFNFKDRLIKAAFSILFIGLGISMVVLPWVIRNYAIHKKIILTTSADAEVFWRGNNPNATGTSYLTNGHIVLTEDKALYDKVLSLNEIGQREFFRKEAALFIKENPAKFLRLFFKKLYYFWWFSPTSGILYPGSYMAIYKIIYAVLIAAFVFGLYNILTFKLEADLTNLLLLLLFLASISVFQSFFYVEGRHRWGIEPVFLIISASGIESLLRLMGSARARWIR